MFNPDAVFSGFSVDNLMEAKKFYSETIGLELSDESMGLSFQLPGGGSIFIYEKKDHAPASFTILNFVVGDIDEAVRELTGLGVKFEHYDNEIKTDKTDIARGRAAGMGPDIAWFRDPAGNILSVLQND